MPTSVDYLDTLLVGTLHLVLGQMYILQFGSRLLVLTNETHDQYVFP